MHSLCTTLNSGKTFEGAEFSVSVREKRSVSVIAGRCCHSPGFVSEPASAMSAAQPPRHKGQAGGFEQRMAKGPDGERACPRLCVFVCSCDTLLPCSFPCSFSSRWAGGRGFKGAGRGSGGSGGPSPNMVGLKPNGVAHVSPQVQTQLSVLFSVVLASSAY